MEGGKKKDKGEKVSYKDIHEKLWAARDFEINHLWQRSIFLATFITITFTLYFSVVDRIISPTYEAKIEHDAVEAICRVSVSGDDLSVVINDGDSFLDNECIRIIVLNGISTIGFAFSVLWICMARGSKYMYERLENGINRAYESDSGFLDGSLSKAVDEDFYECLWNIGDHTYIPKHGSLPLSDYNYHPFSLNGGTYSSSKINIFIGHILAISWCAILLINPIIVDAIDGTIGENACSKVICACEPITKLIDFLDRFYCPWVIIFVVITVLAFFGYEHKTHNKAISIAKLAVILLTLVYIIFFGYWSVIPFAMLYIAIAFLVSYAVQSDTEMRFVDYLAIVIRASFGVYNPDKKQVKWIVNFLRRGRKVYKANVKQRASQANDEQFSETTNKDIKSNADDRTEEYVYSHVINVLGSYYHRCDNPTQLIILDRFLKRKKKQKKFNPKRVGTHSVRILLSNEELKDVFETALMYRNEFSSPFQGIWEDNSRTICISITRTGLDFWIDGCNAISLDITWNGTREGTRLFADTDWEMIRSLKRNENYRLGSYDRTLHLIYKHFGSGIIAYITLSIDNSLSSRIYGGSFSRMSAKIILKDDDSSIGKESKSKRKTYVFTLFRRR